jgi:membrane-associated phospholipid phosphatase
MRNLKPLETTIIGFYLAMSVMNVLFACRLQYWYLFLILNALICAGVILTAKWDDKTASKLSTGVRYWYNAPLILVTFKEIYTLILPVRGGDFDKILILADRWLFGVSPSIFLMRIANPFLTELLQIVYTSFYILPIVLAGSLYLQGKKEAADYTIFSVVFGFFVSYVGYFMLPAVGPRFTLHNFTATETELPGLLLTGFLREIVNSGESIPRGTINPAAFVQRDVFPSGHTMMTLIVIYLSFRYRDRTRYFLMVTGALLIFATVYLRYHYAIDVIAGAFFMVSSLLIGKTLYNYLENMRAAS